MTREEWQRIKHIAGRAWELPREQRSTFVAEICTGDPALRLEIESLLRAVAEAEPLYEAPLIMVRGAAGRRGGGSN
jgi:hypothetical protein